MNIIIKKNAQEVAYEAANQVADILRDHPAGVLGLATGSSPLGLYEELIRRNKTEDLDFSRITTVNLDEYVGLGEEDDQSYHRFMKDNLFSGININPKNTHLPNGLAQDPDAEAREYEELLSRLAPPCVQILGIGINGHIGFNEPAPVFTVPTHVVQLTEETIEANARFFDSKDQVPTSAITMGMGAIMRAEKLILIAMGEGKREAIGALASDVIDPMIPVTMLKVHPDLTVIVDEAAGADLKSHGES